MPAVRSLVTSLLNVDALAIKAAELTLPKRQTFKYADQSGWGSFSLRDLQKNTRFEGLKELGQKDSHLTAIITNMIFIMIIRTFTITSIHDTCRINDTCRWWAWPRTLPYSHTCPPSLQKSWPWTQSLQTAIVQIDNNPWSWPLTRLWLGFKWVLWPESSHKKRLLCGFNCGHALRLSPLKTIKVKPNPKTFETVSGACLYLYL